MTNAEFPDDEQQPPPPSAAPTITMSRAEAEDDDDEATRALRAAGEFAHAGKYAEALARHEWYHQNALRIDRSHYGVRLSFALGDWKELADQYPPALASLKAIRDAGINELEAGTAEPDIFNDVVSINRELGEEAATVALFKSLAARQPALAKKCIVFVAETLIDQGEFELLAEHGFDLVRYLRLEIITYRVTEKMIKSEADHPKPEDFIKNLGDHLVETTLKLFALATKQGDTATATKLKTLAFKRITDPRIKP